MKHTTTEPLQLTAAFPPELPLSSDDAIPLYIGSDRTTPAGIARVVIDHGRSFVVAQVDEASKRKVRKMMEHPTYTLTMGKW